MIGACLLSLIACVGGVSAQGPYSHSQHYALDGNGNRTAITDAAGITTHQTFDAFDRLTSITNIEGTTSYTWQKDGLLSTISRANGVHSAYQYDRAKRVTSLTHSRNGATTLSFVYSYDLNGNRTKEVVTVAAISGQAGSITTTDYTFDDDDRLTETVVRRQPPSATMPDERTYWVLDGVGNRRSEVVTRLSDNTVTSDKLYTYSPRDQLLLMNDGVSGLSVQYGYSGNGNRTSRTVTKPGQPSQTINFIFDARDLMIKVEPEAPNLAGIPTVEYTYDAEGRKTERIETPATGGASEVTLFIYTGQTLLHEAEPAAVAGGLHVTDTYRHGANLDRHVAYAADDTYVLRHYQLDALGTPIAMTDSTGATVTRTAFDAWGNTREQVANGMVQTPWQLPNYSPANTGQAMLLSGDGQSIGFTGYQKDHATGLYYAGARWYDPLVGGFNAMDPAMGDNGRPVTFNKYLYANANPLFYTDPDGRCAVPSVCGFGYGTAFAQSDEERAEVARNFANSNPTLGRTAGVALEVYDTAMVPVNLATDSYDAMKGDAGAESRMANRFAVGQAEAWATLESFKYGPGGPGLRTVHQFASGMGEHAGEMAMAIENDDYVGQGQAGVKVTGDASIVVGGVSAARQWATLPGRFNNAPGPSAPSAALRSDPPNTMGAGAGIAHGAVAVENPAALETMLTPKVMPDYGSGRGRRGTRETREHIDQERDIFYDANPDHRHVGGGTNRQTGQQVQEEYLPGPGGGRRGSSFPDLTFEAPDGSRIRINTVDADEFGNMTPREQANFDRIFEQTGEPIIAVPKPAPKPKKRP